VLLTKADVLFMRAAIAQPEVLWWYRQPVRSQVARGGLRLEDDDLAAMLL
jgi:hypothetical protein